jgi:hypothetical protein
MSKYSPEATARAFTHRKEILDSITFLDRIEETVFNKEIQHGGKATRVPFEYRGNHFNAAYWTDLLDLDDVAGAKEELEKNLINQIVLACAEFDITHPEEA